MHSNYILHKPADVLIHACFKSLCEYVRKRGNCSTYSPGSSQVSLSAPQIGRSVSVVDWFCIASKVSDNIVEIITCCLTASICCPSVFKLIIDKVFRTRIHFQLKDFWRKSWTCNDGQDWGTQIARFMGPTWGPPGSCRPQVGPILAPST